MASKSKDPTAALRKAAAALPDVAVGTSCNQTAYRLGKGAFLYVGEQGGRSKAMFKLDASRVQAEALAASHPDDYQVGSTAWVTARFSAATPMPATLWKRWLKESYALGAPKQGMPKKAATTKPSSRKKAAKKKAARKQASKKKAAAKRKAPGRRVR